MGSQCSLLKTGGWLAHVFNNQIQHKLQCSELIASCSEEQQVFHTAMHFHCQYEMSPRHEWTSFSVAYCVKLVLMSIMLRKCAIAERHMFLTCVSMLSSWSKATPSLRATGQEDKAQSLMFIVTPKPFLTVEEMQTLKILSFHSSCRPDTDLCNAGL